MWETTQGEIPGRDCAMEGRLSESKMDKPVAVHLPWFWKGGNLFAQFSNYPEYRSYHRNWRGEIQRSVQHLVPPVQMGY